MRVSRQLAVPTPLAALALLLLSVSCGGGGGGSSGPPPPPPPQTFQISTTSIPAGFANSSYSATFAANGGTPPYLWNLRTDSDPLPAGLTFSSAGVMSGTPTYAGDPPFYCYLRIQVTDAASHSATTGLGMNVYSQLRINTGTLATGNVGVNYYQGIYAVGGNTPYTYSLAPGSAPLPAGLTLGAVTGLVTGVPGASASGVVDIDFQVQDSAPSGQTITRKLSLNIQNNPVVTSTSLPVGVVGQPYNQTIQAIGGTPPYTFAFLNGSLFGLSLQPDGKVSGSPTQSGSSGFQVQVTDSASPPAVALGTIQLAIRPSLGIITTVLTDAISNTSYSCGVWLDGGTPPQSLRISSGSLPDDLHVEAVNTSNGLFYIRGMPTTIGVTNFTVEASDSSSPPVVVTQALTFRVFDRLVINVPPLPPSLTGDPFSATFTATGGLPPYRWFAGGPPPGLALDPASGVLSGTPTAAFIGSFGVDLFDSSYPGQSTWQYPQVRIVDRLRIATSSLPPLAVGFPADINIAVTGGASTKTWTQVAGTLPAGLNFDTSTGKITGTPTAAETQTITLRVDDAGPPAQSVTGTFTLTSSSALGRNDSIATATPLSNGTYRASISPADDGSPLNNPDTDYFVLAANPGALVRLDTTADRLTPASPMDSVIEIVDANGNRLQTCDGSALGNYTKPCMNDDSLGGGTLDSRLFFLVPGAPGDPPVTFYVRVLDWTGMARPDFLYYITISGAN